MSAVISIMTIKSNQFTKPTFRSCTYLHKNRIFLFSTTIFPLLILFFCRRIAINTDYRIYNLHLSKSKKINLLHFKNLNQVQYHLIFFIIYQQKHNQQNAFQINAQQQMQSLPHPEKSHQHPSRILRP